MSYTIARTEDLAACHALRRVVFIDEQNVPEDLEMDDLDDVAVHVLATTEDGTPVGTARLLFVGTTGKIGRVCVVKEHRGTGLGADLIRQCITLLRETDGLTRAKLGAQAHALGFYEKLGFTVCGPEYMDANIPHFDMDMTL
ncbi:GNAT family N-acetyltransferase [Pseudoruegeria sp. SHC-113]|uniref:GNAT family N-acetyltransferase n=1 Tax=Pseudoruegeria sp. SHC-113 TaxID=2855439 RepID=UPI0021BA9D7D|nr:GNAT family N-acetyltransferase [Pseudoruegeria sp. SHC-113]MCT8158778.1 GNAT family N-acetyltransferase [Pseudoruegeria sp. SHC-113]